MQTTSQNVVKLYLKNNGETICGSEGGIDTPMPLRKNKLGTIQLHDTQHTEPRINTRCLFLNRRVVVIDHALHELFKLDHFVFSFLMIHFFYLINILRIE